MIDGELGAFLRSRRESTSPTAVGLPVGTRRRTPGLRRAELATLAGVSVDYLIRLEQGRDTNPSTQVLGAIAEALHLSDEDVEHLRDLSAGAHGRGLCPGERPTAARQVRPNIATLIERLNPTPAVVLNNRMDLLTWNDIFDRLTRPIGLLERPQPNLLEFTFGDERSQAAYPDWEAVADEQVSYLHEMRRGDVSVDTFARRLSGMAGAAFTQRWDRLPLQANRSGARTLKHPEVGVLNLAFEGLELPDHDYQRLVVYLPADAATMTRLGELAGQRPGALRAVRS